MNWSLILKIEGAILMPLLLAFSPSHAFAQGPANKQNNCAPASQNCPIPAAPKTQTTNGRRVRNLVFATGGIGYANNAITSGGQTYSFHGVEVTGSAGYAMGISPTLRFPLGILATHIRSAYTKNGVSDGTSITISATHASFMLGPTAGVEFAAGSTIFGATAFYNLGLSNNYSVEFAGSSAALQAASAPSVGVDANNRLGVILSADFKVDSSTTAGIYTSYSTGSLDSQDSTEDATTVILAIGLRYSILF